GATRSRPLSGLLTTVFIMGPSKAGLVLRLPRVKTLRRSTRGRQAMKTVAFLVLLLLPAGSLPQTFAGQSAIVITHVNIIDATGRPVQPDMTLVIDRRIIAIGKTGQVRLPTGATTVDATGKFLIPGLWDMHVHMAFGDWLPGGKEVAL